MVEAQPGDLAGADFVALERRFAACLRAPQATPPPDGLDPHRVDLYRRLLYRNVESFMARGFPILRSLLDETRWHALIDDYFARHRARTPLFPRMPQEFLRYLEDEHDGAGYPPFMAELAHYEWLEAELLFDPHELDGIECAARADLDLGRGVLNPLLRTHTYRFPVQRIGPAFQPAVAPATANYLALYRRRNDTVGCLELNVVAARLLDLLQLRPERPLSAQLLAIADELAHPDPMAVVAHGRELLVSLLEQDILLGTRA